MEKPTKEDSLFYIAKLILFAIILLIAVNIYVIARDNRAAIVTGYHQTVNVVVSAITIDENTIGEEVENTVIVPIEIQEFPELQVEEYTFKETSGKYYYNQLDDNAKTIYEAIENNLEKMKSGTYTIKLPDEVADVLYEQNGGEKLNKEFQSAWDAISMDRVDTFFINIAKINLIIQKITYSDKVSYSLEITPKDGENYLLYDKETIDTVLSRVETQRNNIIQQLSGNDYNKVLKVHDWIINNVEYSTDTTNKSIYNIYGAMIEKSAVCEGYAETLKYILDEIDIPCILVCGKATNSEGNTENHEWNYVQLNGKWYAVDCTWDDPIVYGIGYVTNSEKYKYFLKGSNTMSEAHQISGKLSESGITFQYPDLEKNNY